MKHNNSWVKGKNDQWIFCTYDNSSMEELEEKIDTDMIFYPRKDEPINLGLRRYNNQVYSSNYVGICRLKGVNGKSLLSNDGKEVVIKIEPRFPISVVEMLNTIKNDDEFERYLAPQTVRISTQEKEIEGLYDNEVFHFLENETPIFISDNIAKDSSILTATVFISMLKNLCKKPLIGRMISTEENLVGKVKGKILFSQNIRNNTIRGRDDRLYCKYLRYSEDIIENQILRAALKKASQFLNSYFNLVNSCENSYKEMVTYCQNALNKVSLKKITQRDANRIKTTGCYAYYKPVISLAKMVLNEITLESNGASKVTSYVIPYAVSMSKLFEMYVRAYLKHAGVKSYLSTEMGIHLLKYDYKSKVFESTTSMSANYIGGVMKPDIILQNFDTGKTVVFDVKYKNLTNRRNARGDRLQLLAYGLMYNCEDVGIVFPTVSGEKSCYYDKNEIATLESRARYYHQVELSICKEWNGMIVSKLNGTENDILQYLYQLLS